MESETKLLADLLWKTAPIGHGPTKTEYYVPHYEAIVGIGKDHVAKIIIDQNALLALSEMEGFNITAFVDYD